VSIGVRSNRFSASQCWRDALLTGFRRAGICDMWTSGSDAGLGARVREPDHGVEEARGDRVAEVGSAHSSHDGTHIVEAEQVTHGDFGSRVGEPPRTVVPSVY
jgi:hypothetical protein